MVRPYRHDDMEAAIRIYAETFRDPEFNYSWVREDNICRYFTDLERTPGFRAYTLEYDGKVIGFCVGVAQDYFACPVYEIKEIMLTPNQRGLGHGTELLSAIEADLANDGVAVVLLSTLRDMKAFSFYEKNGYVVSEGAVYLSKGLIQA